MEIKLVSKDKRSIELEFPDKDENFLILLQEELLRNSKVETVNYTLVHSILGTPSLIIKMKKGRSETALKNAAQSLIKGFENVEEAFNKSVSA